MRFLLLLLLAALPHAPRNRINRVYQNADLVVVVKELVAAMQRNVYVGPGVEGSVTARLRSVPPQAALAMILADQENEIAYRLVGANTLIVETPEKDCNECFLAPEPEPKGPRREFTLQYSTISPLIQMLGGLYPNCRFRPHPTLNNLYAYGSQTDLEAVAKEISQLDVEPGEPPDPITEKVVIRYGDKEEVKSLLNTLVPDVKMTIEGDCLILEGVPLAIEQAKELLDQLDRPLDQIVLECKLVDASLAQQQNLGVAWTLEQWSAQVTPGSALPLKIGNIVGSPPGLNFLISQSDSHVLASPRVALQSGTEAQIHIGDKFPLVRLSREFGQFQTEYEDLGLSLSALCTKLPGKKIGCRLKGELPCSTSCWPSATRWCTASPSSARWCWRRTRRWSSRV